MSSPDTKPGQDQPGRPVNPEPGDDVPGVELGNNKLGRLVRSNKELNQGQRASVVERVIRTWARKLGGDVKGPDQQ